MGVLLLSIHWGENWSMHVSDVGFNVHTQRREVHLYSSSTDGLGCFESPLLAGLSGPASACVLVQLARPTVAAWHRLTWNYCVWTISRVLHCCVVVFTVSKPIIKLNVSTLEKKKVPFFSKKLAAVLQLNITVLASSCGWQIFTLKKPCFSIKNDMKI